MSFEQNLWSISAHRTHLSTSNLSTKWCHWCKTLRQSYIQAIHTNCCWCTTASNIKIGKIYRNVNSEVRTRVVKRVHCLCNKVKNEKQEQSWNMVVSSQLEMLESKRRNETKLTNITCLQMTGWQKFCSWQNHCSLHWISNSSNIFQLLQICVVWIQWYTTMTGILFCTSAQA